MSLKILKNNKSHTTRIYIPGNRIIRWNNHIHHIKLWLFGFIIVITIVESLYFVFYTISLHYSNTNDIYIHKVYYRSIGVGVTNPRLQSTIHKNGISR